MKRRAHDADLKEDGGAQLTKSSVSSIQAESIWEMTPTLALQIQFMGGATIPLTTPNISIYLNTMPQYSMLCCLQQQIKML